MHIHKPCWWASGIKNLNVDCNGDSILDNTTTHSDCQEGRDRILDNTTTNSDYQEGSNKLTTLNKFIGHSTTLDAPLLTQVTDWQKHAYIWVLTFSVKKSLYRDRLCENSWANSVVALLGCIHRVAGSSSWSRQIYRRRCWVDLTWIRERNTIFAVTLGLLQVQCFLLRQPQQNRLLLCRSLVCRQHSLYNKRGGVMSGCCFHCLVQNLSCGASGFLNHQ